MAAKSCLVLFAAIVVMTHTQTVDAQAVAGRQRHTDPIRYTVSLPGPQTNYLGVSAEVPTARQPQIELMMAVWTPGSYLVREYSRNVEDVAASGADGRPVAVAKTEKN